ncbi:polysaccharide biosynthesis tyrosine autokinase [Dysgonomonas sp. 25]|uniref:GumC family protein n=1 Tax=Dysgonomonas sp. 25 TaxID=2302933 RepID=UPI0013CF7DAA|nr:polysaccharide biosynthesis tyrosine autokinase [Dysgonomonas sp. 25]NDV67944.1 polysaccharide biosynthesis tyrosine autokinase [Dysgonomonas sp. 25]
MTDREFLKKEQTTKIDFRRIRAILWSIKYVLLASIIICVGCTYLYLHYTTPEYRKSITVVLTNQQSQYSDNYQLVSNTLGTRTEKGNDNQIFVLKSAKLMSKVVEQGGFNVRYFNKGNFVDREQYKDTPVVFSFTPKEKKYENADIDMEITFSGGKGVFVDSLLINGDPVSLPAGKVDFEQSIDTPSGTISLKVRGNINPSDLNGQMRITRSSLEVAARQLIGKMDIISSAQQENLLLISLTEGHPKRAEDILNTLIEEYNILSKENDSQSILNTIAFLDERISTLEEDLKAVEGSYAEYKTANQLLDLGSKSQIVVNTNQGYKEQLNNLRLQLNLLESLKKSFQSKEYKLIPVNIGITDGMLNSSISQYNQYVIDRNRLLAASSENNPKVQAVDELLLSLKENIKQSITNLEAGYNLQLQSIARQQNQNQRELVSMPSKQLALTRMSRLQQVKEPLYILLQQKREEALLTLSSLSNRAYVVDKAFGSNSPVLSQKKEIYLFALFIGLMIPIAIVVAMNVFREKIMFEKDIVERTDIPLLGTIPSAEKNRKSPMKAKIITHTGRDPLTESFRMLRSKLERLSIDKKKQGGVILQVSSSGPWEGKSFISINMSLSLAYLGKKVLLIGSDLHKPALNKYLEIDNDEMGLSSYLAGEIKDVDQIIIPHKDTENLDIIPAGPIPPNPSELLSLPLVGEMLDELRSRYDYIIVDSAPFLVVSSGFIMSKYVDSTLYILRSGYTKFSIIDTLNNVIREGSIDSIMLMLNAVNYNKVSIYGAGGLGESYSYGYSYEYVDYYKKKGKY